MKFSSFPTENDVYLRHDGKEWDSELLLFVVAVGKSQRREQRSDARMLLEGGCYSWGGGEDPSLPSLMLLGPRAMVASVRVWTWKGSPLLGATPTRPFGACAAALTGSVMVVEIHSNSVPVRDRAGLRCASQLELALLPIHHLPIAQESAVMLDRKRCLNCCLNSCLNSSTPR